MTKVLLRFKLTRSLDDRLMNNISRAHGIYGFHHVRLNASMDSITVEYDASRLTPSQVEGALHRAGIGTERVDAYA